MMNSGVDCIFGRYDVWSSLVLTPDMQSSRYPGVLTKSAAKFLFFLLRVASLNDGRRATQPLDTPYRIVVHFGSFSLSTAVLQ